MHSNANTELAKDYISKRKIPQLFEVRSFLSGARTISRSLGTDHWSYGT